MISEYKKLCVVQKRCTASGESSMSAGEPQDLTIHYEEESIKFKQSQTWSSCLKGHEGALPAL